MRMIAYTGYRGGGAVLRFQPARHTSNDEQDCQDHKQRHVIPTTQSEPSSQKLATNLRVASASQSTKTNAGGPPAGSKSRTGWIAP